MTILGNISRGIRASVTLDNINLSEDFAGNTRGTGRGYVPLTGGGYATYEGIYRSQPWVSIVVNKLTRGIGRLPLHAYIEGDQEGERTRVRDGELAGLLSRPWERGTPFDLKSSIVGNVCLYGNAVLVKERADIGMPPASLMPSSFACWTIVPGKDTPVDYYVFHSANGARIPFRPSEVVHFKWWGPGVGYAGPSPLEPLKRTLLIEDAALRTQVASYENGMRPIGAMSVDGTLKADVAERLRAQLQDVYGGVDNAFKVMLMEGGAKWQEMSHSLVDGEIVNTRKLTREEVAATFDIPPPVIGILDRATFSNITEQHLMLYMDTMGPWLTMIEETLQAQLIDGEPLMAGQYVEFELNEVLKGDVQKRYDAYQKAQWWMTPNEVRARENLPPKTDPEADQLLIPVNTSAGMPEQGASNQEPAAREMMAEARCPDCNKLLARNVVGAELWCDRCKSAFAIFLDR